MEDGDMESSMGKAGGVKASMAEAIGMVGPSGGSAAGDWAPVVVDGATIEASSCCTNAARSTAESFLKLAVPPCQAAWRIKRSDFDPISLGDLNTRLGGQPSTMTPWGMVMRFAKLVYIIFGMW